MNHLAADDRAEAEQRDEQQQHHGQDGRDPTETEATQADHQRCQQKAQQDRERERDQDVAPEVERADDHHDCGQQRRH
jgi:hypothetical protein